MKNNDYTQSNLLDLDGVIFVIDERGYWVKFEAKSLENQSAHRPHGIKYSLTLHRATGERVLGYDNAHPIPGANKDAKYDHKHHKRLKNRVIEYIFVSAGKLLEDFWNDVDEFLNEE